MLTLLFLLIILAAGVTFLFWLIGESDVKPATAKMLRLLVCAAAAILAIGYFTGFWGSGFRWH